MKRYVGLAGLLVALVPLLAQAPAPATGVRFPTISQSDLKQWLTYLSSDELEGRQVFTEGYGMAAQFVADRLESFGVKPLGEHGTYFQIVKLRSYNVTRHSSVTIEGRGPSRTFKDGDHVRFPARAGGKQSLVFDGAELIGSGPDGSARGSVQGKLLVFVEARRSPQRLPDEQEAALQASGAGGSIQIGTIAPVAVQPRAGGDIPATVEKVDAPAPPRLIADETFFTALLAAAGTSYPDLKARIDRGEAVAAVPLRGVKVTINVDNTYQPAVTRLSRNVVGLVEGSDPALKNTYVLFGAHLDHVGYATSAQDLKGDVTVPVDRDFIWNGADDDGTGSTGVMAIAKAFAAGPKPKRSVVFIWHAGEEADLYGSRYNADFPIVPLDKVQCELNIDMIGRNRGNDVRLANSVFVIGDDRISTDLHNLIVKTNATLAKPLTLDYEYNDVTDPNDFYRRSDHYSYASKGIPIAFFFTGEHPDYHANSDSVDKILFDKQAHITQLIYQVGFAVADSAAVLRRDNRGPRAGKGSTGEIR
jgi:Zn-dependent M28 family amino/carboxypeptidase